VSDTYKRTSLLCKVFFLQNTKKKLAGKKLLFKSKCTLQNPLQKPALKKRRRVRRKRLSYLGKFLGNLELFRAKFMAEPFTTQNKTNKIPISQIPHRDKLKYNSRQ
jgi:hypothetical protein